MAKVAFPREELTPDQLASIKSYHAGLDEEGQPVSKFKYLPGIVRQYRFDAKEGKFKIHLGGDNLKDVGRSLIMRPLAWRIFWDPNLLNMGPKTWAELFFIDEKNAVSAVLFHGYSVDNLNSLLGPLHFDDLMLNDVVLTITADKKTHRDGGNYYIANFNFEGAPKLPEDIADFLKDTRLYREETLTDTADVKVTHGLAMTSRPHAEPLQLEESSQQA